MAIVLIPKRKKGAGFRKKQLFYFGLWYRSVLCHEEVPILL